MTTLAIAWMLAGVWGSGFLVGTVVARGRRPTCRKLMRDQGPDWRRSINHENINAPQGPPPLNLRRSDPVRMDEGHTQRGNGNGAPATPKPDIIPKPKFPPPRKIREDFLP
jgi:hypothetical protein